MKKYCLVGKKLGYSYSKIIHEYLINKFNIDASYDLIEVDKVDRQLLESYDGLTITIPYKDDVLAYVDKNMTNLPANTITNENGYLTAYNTDIVGFGAIVENLKLDKIDKIVILGSGSSSKMVQEYFSGKEIIVISRNAPQLNYDYLDNLTADLLVNTTPVGMNEYNSPIKAELLKKYQGVVDLNYNPVNSKLALDCKKQDVKFCGGLIMLIKQALKGFEIWHKQELSDDLIDEIYQHVLLHTQTKIALIGMPLSGKTSLVNEYNGYDLDREIQKSTNKRIIELLSTNTFRDEETKTLEKLVNENAQLIACGGGAILRHDNMELLKDYLIIYLEVPHGELQERLENSTRPLLKDANDLRATFQKRENIYKKYANLNLNRSELTQFLNMYYKLNK